MNIRILAVLWFWSLVVPAPVGAEDVSGVSQVNMPPGWVWPPSASMRMKGERCLAELAASGTPFHVEPRAVGKIATPVTIPGMRFGELTVQPVYAKRAPVMDCQLALTLVRHSGAFTALGVRTLISGGFYSERRARLRGRSLNVLSRHALGLAVDIRAFVTHDGKTLSVTRHYRHAVVQAVEAMLNARGEFRAVVTPGNDRAHRDHFHLSAKMTIDDGQPDQNLDLALLLEQAMPRPQPATMLARRKPRRARL